MMTKNNDDSFGGRVRKLRKEHGLSQVELAALLPGVKQQSIDQLERGLIERPRYLPELAEVFQTSTQWLLTGRGEKRVKNTNTDVDDELLREVVLGIQEYAIKNKRQLKPKEIQNYTYKIYMRVRRQEYLEKLLEEFFAPPVPSEKVSGPTEKEHTKAK